ncbi:polysialyltransferase family glycosyltransferase [Natrialbaceae archaeon A-CW1-1]
MNKLYLTHTPYHILLSCVLGLENDSDGHTQALVGFVDSDITGLLNAFNRSDEVPFERVFQLSGIYEANRPRRRFRQKRNTIRIRRKINHWQPDRIYSFHDYRPEDQIALTTAQKHGAKRVYVEDGTDAYTDAFAEKDHTHNTLLKGKLFYGLWWKPPKPHGTSGRIDEARVVFPQHATPQLQAVPLKTISRPAMFSLGEMDWFEPYVTRQGLKGQMATIDTIVFVDHYAYANRFARYEQQLSDVITRLVDKGHTVGVKYHPVESRSFLDIDHPSVITVPRNVPAEILYILAPETIEFVVGNSSTALMTARWLLKNPTVISLSNLLEPNASSSVKVPDARLLSVFDDVGILLPEGVQAIDEVFL